VAIVGWLNFGNAMPVSYEELVGSRGGGSDALQSNSIWALQLKLHVSGSPEEYGRRIYDTTSATFSKGRIGRHREHLRRKHYALFASLPQDFMQALGYTKRQMTSSRIMEFMHRPLMIKDVPADLLYTPKLVREDLLGWNIIELAGQYFPIPQGEPIESPTAAQAFFGRQQGYMSLTEAANAVVRCNPAPNFAASADRTTTLVIEGFLGFNVIQHHGRWYGFHQALGPLDIGNLDAATIDAMMKRRQCVTGEDVADIKAEILGLTVQTQRLWRAKQQPTNPSGADTAHRLQEVASRIDAEHIERATELKSVQDRLKDLERQIAELSQPLANLDR
jgi:hypothetical protein